MLCAVGSLAVGGSAAAAPGGIAFVSQHTDASGERTPAHVFSIAPDGSGLAELTGSDHERIFPAWSPNRQEISFIERFGDGVGYKRHDVGIVLADADGSDPRVILRLPDAHALGGGSWSPDGEKLAVWLRDPEHPAGIYVVDRTGSIQHYLGEGDTPDWSPDGSRIAFNASSENGGQRIYTVRPDGSDLRPLPTDERFYSNPKWSPDGETLLAIGPCGCTSLQGTVIYALDADDGNARVLYSTPFAADIESADWSPDGSRIAFSSFLGSAGGAPATYRLFTIAVDGSDRQQIHAPPEGAFQVNWASSSVIPSDDTPPTVEIESPAEGAEYERGTSAVARYSCTDEPGGSGLDRCEGDVPDGQPLDLSTLGPHTFNVSARDTAGNERTTTVAFSVVDRTPPTILLTTPAEGASYGLFANVRASYSCADDTGGSGLVSCVGTQPPGSTIPTGLSALGSHSFSVTATDAAGNQTTVTRGYRVRLLPF